MSCNSTLLSKRETAIEFAEWLFEYVTGEKQDWWEKFKPEYEPEFEDDEEEEKSTEQLYDVWNKENH